MTKCLENEGATTAISKRLDEALATVVLVSFETDANF
jgi:hypothetical protein